MRTMLEAPVAGERAGQGSTPRGGGDRFRPGGDLLLKRRSSAWLAAIVLLGIQRASAGAGDDPTPRAPVVPAFEQFHRGEAGEAGGLLLLSELMCVRCHSPGEDTSWVRPREAPRLERVAERLTIDAIADRIVDPARFEPGTTMPAVLRAIPAGSRERAALDLAHYLAGLAPRRARLSSSDEAAVDRGRERYREVGCAACHDRDGGGGDGHSVPIPALAGRADVRGISAFLRDPLAARPSGRMPSLGLDAREALDIAHYLLRGTRAMAPLGFWRYDGALAAGPLDERDLRAAGDAAAFEPVAGRAGRYSMRFEGHLDVPASGAWTFVARADHGIRIAIDGRIAAERVRGDDDVPTEVETAVHLESGRHLLRVESGHWRGGERLEVQWSGPGTPLEPVPVERLERWPDPVSPPGPEAVDFVRAERGRALFERLGCASCHRLPDTSVGPREAAPLSVLAVDRGCLSADPPPPAPRYALDAEQRLSIARAIEELRSGTLHRAVGEDAVRVDLETWNCYACHARGGRGGVEPFRRDFFAGDLPELGEEGRFPPRLDRVGDKLKEDWLGEVIVEGRRVRRWLRTRMPAFGEAARDVAARLRDVDRTSGAYVRSRIPRDRLVAAGRELVGTTGFGCITCHDYHRREGLTMGLQDLVEMPSRLYKDWFIEYLRDPEAFFPGTRMPAFFVADPRGIGTRRDILGGSVLDQMLAVWTYLEQGERADEPVGLNQKGRELVVGSRPRVYRGKLWEAGWRGVAVGFPGGANLAFDAEELRLSLLWQGRFLDVSTHWNVQGMGRVRPLGHDVWVLAHGAEVTREGDSVAPWPALDENRRFLGYDLDATGNPVFRYRIAGVEVEDAPRAREPEEGGRSAVRRVLRLRAIAGEGPRSFRIARDSNLRQVVGRTIDCGSGRRIRVVEPEAAIAFERVGKETEARIAIDVSREPSRIVLEYRW